MIIEINKNSIIDFVLVVVLVLVGVLGYFTYSLNKKVDEVFVAKEAALKEANNNVNNPQAQEEPVISANFTVGSDEYYQGGKNAKVTIVEFSDVQCPYCQKNHETLKQILAKYGDKVKWVFKHLPLEMHQYAMKGSLAAECAGEQGKFYPYLDLLFANQSSLNDAKFEALAKQLSLNVTKFNSCLSSEKYAAKISKTMDEANTSGISGTPANFINGRVLAGAYPIADFVKIIEEELAK